MKTKAAASVAKGRVSATLNGRRSTSAYSGSSSSGSGRFEVKLVEREASMMTLSMPSAFSRRAMGAALRMW